MSLKAGDLRTDMLRCRPNYALGVASTKKVTGVGYQEIVGASSSDFTQYKIRVLYNEDQSVKY